MVPVRQRPVSDLEAGVIARALQVASVAGISQDLVADVPKLEVVCQCDCGCGSVGFVGDGEEARLNVTRIADAEGKTANGQYVGVLVWGTRSQVTSLELYNGPGDGSLPLPSTLKRFDGHAGAPHDGA